MPVASCDLCGMEAEGEITIRTLVSEEVCVVQTGQCVRVMCDKCYGTCRAQRDLVWRNLHDDHDKPLWRALVEYELTKYDK